MKTISLLSLTLSSITLLQATTGVEALKGSRGLKPKPRSLEPPTERVCKSSQKGNSARFSCSASTADLSEEAADARGIFLEPNVEIRDKIEYKVKTDKQSIKVELEYNSEIREGDDDFFDVEEEEGKDDKRKNDDVNVTKTETKYEVAFDRIIEYAKHEFWVDRIDLATGEDQAFDWELDEIVQEIQLGDWEKMSDIVDDAEGIISTFSVKSKDEVTTFNFTISRADIGEKIKANSMKIDILIEDFPWVRNDTNLAILSTVHSKMKVKMDYAKGALVEHDGQESGRKTAKDVVISFEDASEDIGYVPFGQYTWEDVAEANGLTVDSDAIDDCNNAVVSKTVDFQVVDCGSRNNTDLPGPKGDLEQEEVIVRVVATSPPGFGNETYQYIAYSFVGPTSRNASRIYWDPETGVGYANDASEIGSDNFNEAGYEESSAGRTAAPILLGSFVATSLLMLLQ